MTSIWAYLSQHELQGDWWPLRVGLMCWHLLTAWQNHRADFLLQKMGQTIQEQATNIQNETTRHSFLQHIPEHRQIISLFASTLGELTQAS